MSSKTTRKAKSPPKQIDLQLVTKELTSLATSLVTGSAAPAVEVRTKVSLPEPIFRIYQHIAEVQGLSVEEVVGRAASEGISESLTKLQNSAMQEAGLAVAPAKKDGVNPKDLAKDLGLDFSKITESMGKLGELADQLQDMERLLGNDNTKGDAKVSGDIAKALEHIKQSLPTTGSGNSKDLGKFKLP